LDFVKEKEAVKRYLQEKKGDVFKIQRVSRRTIKKRMLKKYSLEYL
jgi:hypothetical protein